MKIVSNYQPRNLVSFFDMSRDDPDNFDYIKDTDLHQLRFVSYKGQFYDVYESVYSCNLPGIWELIEITSAFSGIVFSVNIKTDQVICGLATW